MLQSWTFIRSFYYNFTINITLYNNWLPLLFPLTIDYNTHFCTLIMTSYLIAEDNLALNILETLLTFYVRIKSYFDGPIRNPFIDLPLITYLVTYPFQWTILIYLHKLWIFFQITTVAPGSKAIDPDTSPRSIFISKPFAPTITFKVTEFSPFRKANIQGHSNIVTLQDNCVHHDIDQRLEGHSLQYRNRYHEISR